MNLYLIERVGKCGWDEYDSAVVVAASEDDARKMHPMKEHNNIEWKEGATDEDDNFFWLNSWVPPGDVKVTLIGTTHLAAGTVVCASFNAG